MSIYTVLPGDTFEVIARRVYGTELKSALISSANPGVFSPLVAGTALTIPDDPAAPPATPAAIFGESVNSIVVAIEGVRFTAWDQISIVRHIDRFDTIEFRTPFEPSDLDLREALRPFSYKSLAVSAGDEIVFKGKLIGVNPSVESNRAVVISSGYSLPGALNDCTLPAASAPVEYLGLNLLQIAEAVAEPFGIAVEIDGEPGPVFDRVAAPVSSKVYAFLAGLSKQRGYVIGSTVVGALSFRKSVAAGSPVARLSEGSGPVLSVSPLFNEQEFYSHITGVRPTAIGIAGETYTEPNVRLQGVVRPYAFVASDTDSADIKAAVQSKMGRMFANSVSYAVPVATWRDDSGKLWAPNTTVTLVSPRSMVYSEYEFIVRSVDFFRNENAETAVLTLMLPGGFAGEVPGRFPWD